MKNNIVWFEVRLEDSSMVSKFNTEKGAKDELNLASKGYPNLDIKDENREYWKNVSSRMIIYKITQQEKIIK